MGDVIKLPLILNTTTTMNTAVLKDQHISYGAKGLYAVLAMRSDLDDNDVINLVGLPGRDSTEVLGYMAELMASGHFGGQA